MQENKLSQSKVWKYLFYISCAATVLYGIIFTLSLFITTSFIEDEIYSVICSNPGEKFAVLFSACHLPDAHPPLYIWMLYAYNHIAYIQSEIWPRIPSILFWIANAAAAWFYFPKKLGKTAKIIFFTMMFSSAFLAIYLSSARSYAMLLFLSTCLLFSSLKILDYLLASKPLGNKQLIVFFILGFLTCFTHYYGAVLFVITAELLILTAIYKKREWAKLSIGLTVVLLVFFCWLIPSYFAIKAFNVFDGSWWSNRQPVWLSYTGFLQLAFGWDWYAQALAGLLFLGILLFKKDKENKLQPVIFCASLYLLVFAAMTVISVKINIMQVRYFIVVLPALYLLFAVICSKLLEQKPHTVLLWTLLLILIFKGNLAFMKANYKYQWEAKPFAEEYLKNYKGKDILLASYYPYSAEISVKIYSYYLKELYDAPVNITFIMNKTPQEMSELLSNPDAIIYLPGCNIENEEKINALLSLDKISYNAQAKYCIFTAK